MAVRSRSYSPKPVLPAPQPSSQHPTPLLPHALLNPDPANSVNPNPSANHNPAAATTDPPHRPLSVSELSDNTAPALFASAAATAAKTQPVFIHKLYDMLEDLLLSHLIWWSPSNDSFCLYPGEEFSNVLAQYFKHTNIASFIRQLNMYGFHKVNDNFQGDGKLSPAPTPPANSATKWEFRHLTNQFRKGDVHLLGLIKRKSSKVINSHKEIVSLKTLPPTSAATLDEPKPPLADQFHLHVHPPSAQLHAPTPNPPLPLLYPGSVMAHHQYQPMYVHSVLNVPHLPLTTPFQEHAAPSPSSIPPVRQHLQLLQLQLQPQAQQPQTQQPQQLPQLLQAVNLKLIEITNSLNSLTSGYLDLSARYEALSAAYTRNQADLLRLTELLESSVRGEGEVKRELVRTKTPTNRSTTPGPEAGMSPMTVKPAKLTTKDKDSELDSFKQQLQANMVRPVQPEPRLGSYHLNDVLAVSKLPSNVVPQPYPINPNYSLYPSPEIATFRQFKMSSEDLKKPQPAVPVSRHVSVFMDPLQPIPGRTAPKLEELLGSPVPVGLAESAAPPADVAAPPYVQVYQPMPFHQQPVHLFYQHIHSNQQRTVSLPILENLLLHSAQSIAQTLQQRHSTTTIASNPMLPRGHENEGRGRFLLSTLRPGGGRTPLLGVSGRDSNGPAAVSPSPSSDPNEGGAPKKQLPSVLEIDKSIKTSGGGTGRVEDLLQESADERNKKRKLGV